MNCLKRLKTFFIKERESPLLGWPKIEPSASGKIYWHLVNFPSNMRPDIVVAEFDEVFQDWQEIMNAVSPKGQYLTYESTRSLNKAHIKFVFVESGVQIQEIKCSDGQTRSFYIPHMMDGVGGILAYVPENEHTIYFDDSENWTDVESEGPTGIRLFTVVLHELFHVHDLKHSEERKSVRNPYYSSEEKRVTKKDIEDLELAYGPTKEKFKNVI